jgi:hypothetical protein
MSAQVRDGMCQSMKNIHEGTRSKMKEEVEIKSQEAAHTFTTKCCYTCGGEEHLSKNFSRKRERFPTFKVEYEDQELEDLLALERPKKKKKNKAKEQRVENGSTKKRMRDLSHIKCFKCGNKGHYMNKCTEKLLM